MEPSEHYLENQTISLTIDLPIKIVDWLDHLKAQTGIRSRSLIIEHLLRELSSATENGDAPDTQSNAP